MQKDLMLNIISHLLLRKIKKGESMPSRHVFSITIIAMCWLYIYQPIGIVLLILTIILAAVRVIAGVHFIRDVIARNSSWHIMWFYRLMDIIIPAANT